MWNLILSAYKICRFFIMFITINLTYRNRLNIMKIYFPILLLFTCNVLFVSGQTSTTTTTTIADSSKAFKGTGQYSTWSLGVNAGIASPFLAIGGANASSGWKAGLGYGVSIRDRLAHSFSLQIDLHGGSVNGDNASSSGLKYGSQSFSTDFYSGSISGLINVASMDFLHRANSVNFYLSAGTGLAYYKPTWIDGAGISHSYSATSLVLPVGGAIKFKLSDALALNVGYTMNFIDDNNFAGYHTTGIKSHYSYGYGGLEYTFGTAAKRNLDWINPVAITYNELYDAELRAEVAALKTRTANVEFTLNDLKKDSDGDGVADQFDKCPNTPTGTVVDGAGCPIIFPKAELSAGMGMALGSEGPPAFSYSSVLFKFNKAEIKPSSFPTVDDAVAYLKTNNENIELTGYAAGENDVKKLSVARAEAVKNYLINAGISASRIKIKGLGASHPIADSSTQSGLIKNRRVEFKLTE